MIIVLVAAVGVLGTALGASLTAIIAARTENRRQAALERQQAQQVLTQRNTQALEVRVEHLRWRRDRRQSTYLDFLDAIDAADRANQQYFRDRQTAPEPVAVEQARLQKSDSCSRTPNSGETRCCLKDHRRWPRQPAN